MGESPNTDQCDGHEPPALPLGPGALPDSAREMVREHAPLGVVCPPPDEVPQAGGSRGDPHQETSKWRLGTCPAMTVLVGAAQLQPTPHPGGTKSEPARVSL